MLKNLVFRVILFHLKEIQNKYRLKISDSLFKQYTGCSLIIVGVSVPHNLAQAMKVKNEPMSEEIRDKLNFFQVLDPTEGSIFPKVPGSPPYASSSTPS